MSTASERSEIAVLKVQMNAVQKDLAEVKGDLRDVKTLLFSSAETYVPLKRYEEDQKAARSSGMLKTIVTVIATALITAMAYALIVGRSH